MEQLTLPADYKYVLAAFSTIPIVNLILDILVASLRKQANVPLPALFATPEEAAKDPVKHRFNCAQKAALNFSEHIGSFVAGAIVAGFYLPKYTAALVLLQSIGRVVYTFGYATGNPKNRNFGMTSLTYILMAIPAAFYGIKSII